MKPLLLINLKTYEQGTGSKAEKIVEASEKVAKKMKANIVVAPQTADIFRVSEKAKIPVYAQHIDPVGPGSNTGWTLPLAVKRAGATGTIINHSEHRLVSKRIGECVRMAKDAGLVTVCCAANPKKAASIAKFSPDFIAVEPPYLIGGNVSVSEARPEIITKTVDAVKSVNPRVKVLCGAGIHSRKDVEKSLELGASGVLVASGVVKAKSPQKAIEDLAGGLV